MRATAPRHARLRGAWLLAAALCVLNCAGAAAQVVVARVNGAGITLDALDRGFEQELRARKLNIARMQRPEQVRDIRREVLERLIREELLWQKARRDGRVASDQDVDLALAHTIEQFKTREAFLRRIARDGLDEEGYREYARRMLSADRAAQALVAARVSVTDADVEQFYGVNAHRFSSPERLRLREILIGAAAGASAEERAAARARAGELRVRLLGGEDFDSLARRFSNHPTRQWGGAHDPVTRGMLAAPLEEAAFRLRAGEISEVIETGAGFHLLRLDEHLPAVTVALAEARERIREHLMERRAREVLDREVAALRAEAAVEILLPL